MASWRGRVVIVAAVAVSLGTSKPGWHVEADLPVVPAERRALELTVEASARPWVTCNTPDGTVDLHPQITGTTYTYLCPPLGHYVTPISIGGRSAGGGGLFCNDGPPKPPPDQFIRVKQLVPVDSWLIEVTQEVPFTRTEYDHAYGETSFEVIHPPGGQVTATVEAAELVDVSLSAGDGTRFSIFAKYRDAGKPVGMVKVHAKVYGTGVKPDPSTITIEGRGR